MNSRIVHIGKFLLTLNFFDFEKTAADQFCTEIQRGEEGEGEGSNFLVYSELFRIGKNYRWSILYRNLTEGGGTLQLRFLEKFYTRKMEFLLWFFEFHIYLLIFVIHNQFRLVERHVTDDDGFEFQVADQEAGGGFADIVGVR